jgi:hypothetical protein
MDTDTIGDFRGPWYDIYDKLEIIEGGGGRV